MNKNFHDSKGSSTHVRNPVPRWRIVFIALVLALAIGSAGQIPPVQAATAKLEPADIKFELNVYPENLPTICVKQKLNLYVSVSKTVSKVIGGKLYELPGTTGLPQVTSSVKGSGKIQKQLGDIDAPRISQVHYMFTADKPGTTTLKFSAPIENSWIGTKEEVIGSGVKVEKEVTVKVRNCKYKVTTIGEWHPSLEGNPVIMATSGDAEVKADEQGNFTGTATVNWIVNVSQIGDCVQEHTIGSSQVEWTGQMDDADQLTMNGDYQPASGSVTVFCGETWTFPEQLTPDLLQASVSSYGGVSRQSQVIESEGVNGTETHPGTVTIIVIPDEDEAAVFIPANQEAGWDGFSNFFGALLALH